MYFQASRTFWYSKVSIWLEMHEFVRQSHRQFDVINQPIVKTMELKRSSSVSISFFVCWSITIPIPQFVLKSGRNRNANFSCECVVAVVVWLVKRAPLKYHCTALWYSVLCFFFYGRNPALRVWMRVCITSSLCEGESERVRQ